jgi:hypothetical protein
MRAPGLVDEARAACEEDRVHLVAIDRWSCPPLPTLSDGERDWVHDRIDELQRDRQARSEAHRERLTKTATFLGREVGGHRVLLADAQRRLDAIALTMDPETGTPQLLVPYAEAVEIIEAAFSSSFRAASVWVDIRAVA